eukprot:gene5350-7104_t
MFLRSCAGWRRGLFPACMEQGAGEINNPNWNVRKRKHHECRVLLRFRAMTAALARSGSVGLVLVLLLRVTGSAGWGSAVWAAWVQRRRSSSSSSSGGGGGGFWPVTSCVVQVGCCGGCNQVQVKRKPKMNGEVEVLVAFVYCDLYMGPNFS